MDLPYYVVDVFTAVPLLGNALAVFPDATGLDSDTMQRIARELNLSETTFILPRESNDRRTRVRIFTPGSELQFAGHPTIGTAFVMRALGIVPRGSKNFVLQENVGDVAVRVDGGEDPIIWLTTPPIEELGEYPRERCAAMLGLQSDQLVADVPCELLSAGNAFIFVTVDRVGTVDQARLDMAVFEQLVKDRSAPTSVFVFATTDTGAYSRMFGPQLGVAEDPATGSATGPLALFMMKHGLAQSGDGTRFVCEQGTKMGRRSFLHAHVNGERGAAGIEVGGNVVQLAQAVMRIPVPSVATA
ncbi:MAG: PhzF family phenazine biosynthesis protein [Candidatus Eremiobacteraeota bacterium]|nr:PhzF family phenazine biosynthesis protein [Candidatus Eremiobacteraeota bacterium]